jgi:hypothetical protein
MDSSEPQSHDLVKFLAWLEVNKKRVAIGAAGVMVGIMVIIVVVQSRAQRDQRAGQALSDVRMPRAIGEVLPAETIAAYLAVARDYPGTKAAEHALMLAAGGYYMAANYGDAQKQFEALLKSYPESTWTPDAVLGVAATFEAQGRTNDAIAKYEEVRRRYGTATVVDDAKLALGRLFQGQGKVEEAFKLYEEMAKAGGGYQSRSGMEVQSRLQDLIKDHPELIRPKQPPTPPPTNRVANATNAPVIRMTNALQRMTSSLVRRPATSAPVTLTTNVAPPPANRPGTSAPPLLLKPPAATNK